MSNQEEEASKPVSYNVFMFSMSILLIIIGYMFTEINKVQSVQTTQDAVSTQLLIQLTQVQTDVSWIKDKISVSPVITK